MPYRADLFLLRVSRLAGSTWNSRYVRCLVNGNAGGVHVISATDGHQYTNDRTSCTTHHTTFAVGFLTYVAITPQGHMRTAGKTVISFRRGYPRLRQPRAPWALNLIRAIFQQMAKLYNAHMRPHTAVKKQTTLQKSAIRLAQELHRDTHPMTLASTSLAHLAYHERKRPTDHRKQN